MKREEANEEENGEEGGKTNNLHNETQVFR